MEVHCEGVKGAIAKPPLSLPQERNPLRSGKSGYGRKTSNLVAPIWRDTAQLLDRAAWGRV